MTDGILGTKFVGGEAPLRSGYSLKQMGFWEQICILAIHPKLIKSWEQIVRDTVKTLIRAAALINF